MISNAVLYLKCQVNVFLKNSSAFFGRRRTNSVQSVHLKNGLKQINESDICFPCTRLCLNVPYHVLSRVVIFLGQN